MRKPNGYEKAREMGSYTPLALGGHVCVIKGYEETYTKTSGRQMLKVALDIADGDEQAGYFQHKYDLDDREGKRWGCIAYIVAEDENDNATRGLADFVTSLEESNPGFTFPWGSDNAQMIVGKKIGCVFGLEEYKNQSGEIKRSTKPKWFQSIQTVKNAPIPKVKEYRERLTDSFKTIKPGEIPFF